MPLVLKQNLDSLRLDNQEAATIRTQMCACVSVFSHCRQLANFSYLDAVRGRKEQEAIKTELSADLRDCCFVIGVLIRSGVD